MIRIVVAAATVLAFATTSFADEPSEQYQAEIEEWREGRMQRLKAGQHQELSVQAMPRWPMEQLEPVSS